MNENRISAAEEAARESARRDSGQFGERTHEKPNCAPMVAAPTVRTGPISEVHFDEVYDPQQTPAGETRFTADEAAKFPDNQIWTLCEGDREGEVYAIAGFDESDRNNEFVVTAKPWPVTGQQAIFITAEEDRPESGRLHAEYLTDMIEVGRMSVDDVNKLSRAERIGFLGSLYPEHEHRTKVLDTLLKEEGGAEYEQFKASIPAYMVQPALGDAATRCWDVYNDDDENSKQGDAFSSIMIGEMKASVEHMQNAR